MTNLAFSSSSDLEKNTLLQEFDELLNSIDSAGTKEKILWRQIYNNSITDRSNANLCFLDLYPHLQSDIDNHMTHGMQAVQYLTRMEKSNEQLIKLATIIQKALESQQQEESIDTNALFDEIQKSRKETEQKGE